MSRAGAAARWLVAGLVAGGSLWVFLDVAGTGLDPDDVPAALWYGNWRDVVVVTGVFTAFVLGFLRPRRRREWRGAGLAVAFLISLFTEMFGVPFTVYLVASFLGLPPEAFGRDESLLWVFALDRLGVLPLARGRYAAMVVSVALVALGVSLLAVGWATVYGGRGRLVTTGVYRGLRHPQYLGLILIVLGFAIQWPTLPTLGMAPILGAMYLRLARREDDELAQRFGEAFHRYAARTPAFLPWPRPSGRDLPRTNTRAEPVPAEAGTRAGEEA